MVIGAGSCDWIVSPSLTQCVSSDPLSVSPTWSVQAKPFSVSCVTPKKKNENRKEGRDTTHPMLRHAKVLFRADGSCPVPPPLNLSPLSPPSASRLNLSALSVVGCRSAGLFCLMLLAHAVGSCCWLGGNASHSCPIHITYIETRKHAGPVTVQADARRAE